MGIRGKTIPVRVGYIGKMFFGVLLAASTSFAQSILDQSFTGLYEGQWYSFGGGAMSGGIAQVYTAGVTGNLTSVKLSVATQNGGPVVVEILDPATPDNGTWFLLGYTMITPPDTLTCCALTTASFSSPIAQVAGKQYAIAVYPTYVSQAWFGSMSTHYAGGGVFVNGPSWADITPILSALPTWEQITSFYFQTYVKPVRGKK